MEKAPRSRFRVFDCFNRMYIIRDFARKHFESKKKILQKIESHWIKNTVFNN